MHCVSREDDHVAKNREFIHRCGIANNISANHINHDGEEVHYEVHCWRQNGKHTLIEELRFCELSIRIVELLFLIFFGIKCAHDANASEVFTRDAINTIGEFLNFLEARNNECHHGEHYGKQEDDCDTSGGAPLPTFAGDLNNRPSGRHRCAHEHLSAHRDKHLNLSNIVSRASNEAASRELLDLMHAKTFDFVEKLFARIH